MSHKNEEQTTTNSTAPQIRDFNIHNTSEMREFTLELWHRGVSVHVMEKMIGRRAYELVKEKRGRRNS
jgi:hypothetical protein